MDEKTLRIIVSGISTLWPGPPRNGDKPPVKAFVMMAANRERESGNRGNQTNDWKMTIPDHFPFVSVDSSVLENPPAPDDRVDRKNGGDYIYYFRDARVKIDPAPQRETLIEYFSDPTKPLADRPGSDDVAPADDIRWLADIRDILSKPSPLKKTADPTAATVGDDVAAVVNLDGGTLRANFPCDSVQPKIFMDKDGKVVSGLRRVLATEFIIDIPYPKETQQVSLQFQDLRNGTSMIWPQKLVLKWPEKTNTLEVRMGNDTKDEARRLNTPQRCEPVRQDGPVLKPRDDDFDLHYNLLQIDDIARPLPQNDPHQTRFDGCKPATT
jgi:hypothetical protein